MSLPKHETLKPPMATQYSLYKVLTLSACR